MHQPYERLTTRGNSQTVFPSMHERDIAIRLIPVFCGWCDLQVGYSNKPNKVYCCIKHEQLGILFAKYFEVNKSK